MDSTGVGNPVVDDLVNKGINVSPYVFTYNSRNELLINLQILLEQNTIKIPDDPELIEELKSAFFDITAQGRTKIVVPDDKHDDRIMSLALAVWGIPVKPLTPQNLRAQSAQAGGVTPMYGEFGI